MTLANRLDGLDLDDVSFAYRVAERRESVVALSSVSMSVRGGEVVALAGHNGAGKSTALALAAGLLSPDAGSVRLDDVPATDWLGSGRVGLLTQRLRLYPKFTVAETLTVFARIQRISVREVDRIARLLRLDDWRDTWAGRLSTGLRKRLALGVVLLSDPDVLLLDEPFSGLDPESVDVLCGLIRHEASRGAAIIVASHDLPELEAVADRLTVLENAKVLASGTMADLRSLVSASVGLRAETDVGEFPLPTPLGELIPRLQELERRGVTLRTIREARISLAQVYAHLHRTDDRTTVGRVS